MKKLKIPYSVVIIGAVLAIAVMAVFSNFFIYPRRTIISNISKYEKTIKFAKTEEVNIDNRLSHFPDKIPDGAKNAEFTFMTRYNGTFCYL